MSYTFIWINNTIITPFLYFKGRQIKLILFTKLERILRAMIIQILCQSSSNAVSWWMIPKQNNFATTVWNVCTIILPLKMMTLPKTPKLLWKLQKKIRSSEVKMEDSFYQKISFAEKNYWKLPIKLNLFEEFDFVELS